MGPGLLQVEARRELRNYSKGLRPSDSPTPFRLRAKRFGETSPEPWRRRALAGPPTPRSAPVARFAALTRVVLRAALLPRSMGALTGRRRTILRMFPRDRREVIQHALTVRDCLLAQRLGRRRFLEWQRSLRPGFAAGARPFHAGAKTFEAQRSAVRVIGGTR